MGGYGSTRWGWHTARPLVEECLKLGVTDLKRLGYVRPGRLVPGTVNWGGTSSIRVALDLTAGDAGRLWLAYRWPAGEGGRDLGYAARVSATAPPFGGRRWWLHCPLGPAAGGPACGRRVAALHFAGGLFGCRRCHGLGYRSTREWDQRAAAALRSPWMVDRLLGRGRVSDLGLLLKAGALEDARDRRTAGRR